MTDSAPPSTHDAMPDASPGSGMDRRVTRSRWSRLRRLRLPLLALAAVGGIVAMIRLVPASGSLAVAQDQVTIAVAQHAPFQDYLPLRATVAPLRTVYVGAVAGGVVERVALLDGASVHTGEVLATLTNTQLELDVSSREASIAGQLGSVSAQRLSLQQNTTAEENAVAEARYTLLKAQRELDIRRRLHEQGFEADAGVRGFEDEARYDTARLRTLRQARLRDQAIAARQADEIDQTAARLGHTLDVVRDSLQALTLRAPVAGRLTDFALQPGQSLKQGDQIGRIDSEDAYRLEADIDEFYLGRVSPGQHATAELDAGASRLTVSRVRPQVAGGQFRAELSFDGASPPSLRRGESVDARITLGDTRPALVLPNGPWLDGSGGSFVFVLDANGRHAVRRAITSGRRNPEQVEITSGLSAGERVITSSIANAQNFTSLLMN